MRKYFGTDGIRGRIGSDLMSPEFFIKLGWAVGKVLARSGDSKVLIGKDTRISGYMLESAMEAGLAAAGVDIHLLGPMPTPAIAYLTRTFRAQAGIVISASHNVYHDNGIKFFSAQGTKLSEEVELQIEAQLDQSMDVVDSADLGKAYRIDDAPGRYIEFCKNRVAKDIDFSGMKIVVDCANGATYHIAPAVFKELGATVIELGVDPNGCNINDQCGSTHPEVLKTIVLAEKADLGIALDGDGDRLILVDHRGEIVDGDEALYVITKQYQAANLPIHGVVGTQMSNMGLEVALQKEGIDFVRTQVGDRYVAEELRRFGWLLGGESSGHIICRDATTTGDGIIAALKVLSSMKETDQSLHQLKKGMDKFPQALINLSLQNPKQVAASERVLDAVSKAEQKLAGNGRILVRASGTEPLLRVMVEARDAKQAVKVANDLADVINAY